VSRADDVEPVRVSGPDAYAREADGPVGGFRITDDEGVVGVLWYADDPSQDAGGIVYPQHVDRAANAAVHWYRLLREAKAQRLPVRDAVTGLVTRSEHGPWGAPSSDVEHWPSLRDLREEVHRLDAAAHARTAAPKSVVGSGRDGRPPHRGAHGPAMSADPVGCGHCRVEVLRGALPMVGRSLVGHVIVRRCPICSTSWLETERLAYPVSREEAAREAPDVRLEA